MEEIFKLEKIDEMQKYAVIFHKTKGERQCNRTANKLCKLPLALTNKNINGTVDNLSCMEIEKVMSSTLNLNGIKWVRIRLLGCFMECNTISYYLASYMIRLSLTSKRGLLHYNTTSPVDISKKFT